MAHGVEDGGGAASGPATHPFTLSFVKPELESEYLGKEARSRWPVLVCIFVFDIACFLFRFCARFAGLYITIGGDAASTLLVVIREMGPQLCTMLLLHAFIQMFNRRSRKLGDSAVRQEELLLSMCMALAICSLLATVTKENASDYVYAGYFLICTSSFLKIRWWLGALVLSVPTVLANVWHMRVGAPSILPRDALVHIFVAWAVGALMAYLAEWYRRQMFASQKMASQAHSMELLEAQARINAQRQLAAAQAQAAHRALSVAREKASNEAKSDFMSLMCHEVRTPLNGCLASAEMLLETALEDEQRELAKTICVSGSILLSTVSNFLDFFKLEAGKGLDVVRTEVNLRSLVSDVHCIIEAMIGRDSEVKLLEPAMDGTTLDVLCDPDRVRGILLNLYTNAAKFTKGGHIGLRVSEVGGDFLPTPPEGYSMVMAAPAFQRLQQQHTHAHASGHVHIGEGRGADGSERHYRQHARRRMSVGSTGALTPVRGAMGTKPFRASTPADLRGVDVGVVRGGEAPTAGGACSSASGTPRAAGGGMAFDSGAGECWAASDSKACCCATCARARAPGAREGALTRGRPPRHRTSLSTMWAAPPAARPSGGGGGAGDCSPSLASPRASSRQRSSCDSVHSQSAPLGAGPRADGFDAATEGTASLSEALPRGGAAAAAEKGSASQGAAAQESDVASTRWLLFEVIDTGVGIGRDGLKALFKEYVQGTDDEMKKPRSKGGTGLGLSICSKQVGVLGGRIGACSHLGNGSVFWFTMPLLPADTSPGVRGGGGGENASSSAIFALSDAHRSPLLQHDRVLHVRTGAPASAPGSEASTSQPQPRHPEAAGVGLDAAGRPLMLTIGELRGGRATDGAGAVGSSSGSSDDDGGGSASGSARSGARSGRGSPTSTSTPHKAAASAACAGAGAPGSNRGVLSRDTSGEDGASGCTSVADAPAPYRQLALGAVGGGQPLDPGRVIATLATDARVANAAAAGPRQRVSSAGAGGGEQSRTWPSIVGGWLDAPDPAQQDPSHAHAATAPRVGLLGSAGGGDAAGAAGLAGGASKGASGSGSSAPYPSPDGHGSGGDTACGSSSGATQGSPASPCVRVSASAYALASASTGHANNGMVGGGGGGASGGGMGGGMLSGRYSPRRSLQIVSVRGLRVLLVEDNLINQTVARKMLHSLGMVCEVTANGLEAVNAVERTLLGAPERPDGVRPPPFDVVLMDMSMPVMGGVDATRAIRRLGCRVPILAMTANASDKDRDECRSSGMDGFLSKPVLKDRLAEAIEQVMVRDQRR